MNNTGYSAKNLENSFEDLERLLKNEKKNKNEIKQKLEYVKQQSISINTKLSNYQKSYANLQIRYDSLKNANEKYEKENKEIGIELSKSQKNKAEIEKLSEELKKTKKERDEYKKDSKIIENLPKKKKELSEIENKLKIKHKELSEIENKLKIKYKEYENKTNKYFEEKQKSLKKQEEEFEKATNEFLSKKKLEEVEITIKEKALENWQKELFAMEKTIIKKRDQVADHFNRKNQIEQLNAQLSDVNTTISEKNVEIIEKQNKIETLDEQIGKKQKDFDELDERYNDAGMIATGYIEDMNKFQRNYDDKTEDFIDLSIYIYRKINSGFNFESIEKYNELLNGIKEYIKHKLNSEILKNANFEKINPEPGSKVTQNEHSIKNSNSDYNIENLYIEKVLDYGYKLNGIVKKPADVYVKEIIK